MAYYNGKKIIGNGRLDLNSPYYEFAKSEYEKGLNMYDGITLKGNIVSSNNTIDSTSVDRLISGSTYEINPKKTYYMSFGGLDRYSTYYYNSSMQHIGSASGWIPSGGTFTTPSNAKYVRITFSYNDNRVINSTNELTNVYLSEFGPIVHKVDISNLKYLHNINLISDAYRVFIRLYSNRSTSYTIVELSKWLYENGYNSLNTYGVFYSCSGGNRNINRSVYGISCGGNNGSNEFMLGYVGDGGTTNEWITVTTITDHVIEII